MMRRIVNIQLPETTYINKSNFLEYYNLMQIRKEKNCMKCVCCCSYCGQCIKVCECEKYGYYLKESK